MADGEERGEERGGRKEGRREEGRGGEKDLAPEARCAAGAVRGSCRLSRGLQHAAQESESTGRKNLWGLRRSTLPTRTQAEGIKGRLSAETEKSGHLRGRE